LSGKSIELVHEVEQIVDRSHSSSVTRIVLHGIWSTPRFYLWGERLSEDSSDQEFDGRKEESHASEGWLRHPRALSTTDLRILNNEYSVDGSCLALGEDSNMALWLPTVRGVPLASEPACQGSAELEEIRLQPVFVPALGLAPADAIDVLIGMSKARLLNCHASLRYWRTLAKYTMSLVARGQFVPTIEEDAEGRFAGRWRGSISDRSELAWLKLAVDAMPPVCRAIVTDDKDSVTPLCVVDGFISCTAESIIQRSLSSDPFFLDFRRSTRTEDDWPMTWLASLLGDSCDVRSNYGNINTIASAVRTWVRKRSHKNLGEPLNLGFTLVEPQDDDGDVWRLRFELRTSDTGELLDLEPVRGEEADGWSILSPYMADRRQRLKNLFSQAAKVFDPIRRATGAHRSNGVDLSPTEVRILFRDGARRLRDEGFSVNLPVWVENDPVQMGLKLLIRLRDNKGPVQAGSADGLGLGNVLEFDWRVALGDHEISMEEFKALVAQSSPLVKVGDRWVDIDQRDAEKALEFMRREHGGLTLGAAIRLAAGFEDLESGLPILGLQGDSWLGRLFGNGADICPGRVEQPHEFRGVLRPYQLRGLEWLALLDRFGLGSCLADDMGLGKTIQLIALLLHERRDHDSIRPTLLFVPMSVLGNWTREFQRFAPSLRVLVHYGPERFVGNAFVEAAALNDVVITTYGLASRDLDALQRVQWRRIALDEAQKIKNPSTGQAIAIRSMKADRRVALTGTPIENNLSELWSIMEMLNPGLLGSESEFRNRFAAPIEKRGNSTRVEQLRRLIRPFVLRRLKTDPNVECDLPEKMEMPVHCNLTTEQVGLYQRTVKEMLDQVSASSGIRRRGLILATLTKLKQICNHPINYLQDGGELNDRSGKCERLVEMLEEVLEDGGHALVFTQYKVMGDLLMRLIKGRLCMDAPFLHGGTSAKRRDEMVDTFQDPDNGLPVLLISLKAGGLGLNLTRANHVFHFDRWWNPAVEDQATDRAHRIGQTRRVLVHKFVSIGTIEDRIDRMLSKKAALADGIVGSGDEWLTELSTDKLKEFLTLSREAVLEA
jgi:hypothetical protein